MLSKFKVQHYKSLFDTEIELEPLTVFIGPNGSGKSNICEALAGLSNYLEKLRFFSSASRFLAFDFLKSFRNLDEEKSNIYSKFWHGIDDYFLFEIHIFNTLQKIHHENPKEVLGLSLLVNVNSIGLTSKDFHDSTSQAITDPSINQKALLPAIKITLKDSENIYSETSKNSGYADPTQDINDLIDFLNFNNYRNSGLANSIQKVDVYYFVPEYLSTKVSSSNSMDRSGKGITNSLVDILLENRESFIELEERFTKLIPNIKRISLPRADDKSFSLELVDKYSEHHIPSTEISDGTLRILGFLTALYQKETPSIICFEELENGVHPWLLHKMMELLKIVSTEGINGKPVQVLITTHSPLLLNYVEPYQVRAVELDGEGKTQVHKLPIDSVRFQKALEAYDGELGELWFTNVFGGNPT